MKEEGTEFTRKEKRLKILATDEIESIYDLTIDLNLTVKTRLNTSHYHNQI
jgi:hypothetical protein